VFAVSRSLWRSRDYWIGIGLAAFTSIGLAIPFFLPYLYVQEEMGFVRTLNDARPYSANLFAWAASAAWAHRWWLPAIDGYNDFLFPGVLTTGLGVAGAVVLFRRVRDVAVFYMLIAAFAFWSSFGPDAGLYRLFYAAIPVFSFLRAPSRMGIMVTLALTVLAAEAISHLIARHGRAVLVGSVLALAAVGELATVPLAQFRATVPFAYAYRVLATLPHGAVVEFPYWYERPTFPRHAYYMLRSTVHWKPLVNGYSDHIPDDFRKSVLTLSSFPSRQSFAILGKAGARYVVFHLDMYDAQLRARLFERLETYSEYLRPLVQEGDVWLYEIVAWPN